MRELGAAGSPSPAKANRRQRPSAFTVWPRCIGLASARRITGAEWKRVPITRPSGQMLMGRFAGDDRGR